MFVNVRGKKINPGEAVICKSTADSPLSKQASKRRCPFLGAPVYPGGVTVSLLTFPTRASSPPVSLPVQQTPVIQCLAWPKRERERESQAFK